MVSSVSITPSGWRVPSAISGSPIPIFESRPRAKTSGPLVSRCKPARSISYHCPKQGYNERLRRHSSRPLQHSFRSWPQLSNWWPGEHESFKANLSKGISKVEAKAEDGHDLGGSRRHLILWSDGPGKKVSKREDIDKLLTGECWDEGWRPELCYLSTTDYTPPKTQRLLQMREFESNGLDISEIQGKLRRDYPNTLDVETIMIMGTSTPDEFKKAVMYLTDSTEGQFEDAVAYLTGKRPEQYFRKPAFVAMLKSKWSKENKRWQEDRSLTVGGWDLVNLERFTNKEIVDESFRRHGTKRKRDDM